MSGEDFRDAVNLFRGEVLARLDAMDRERREARNETQEILAVIQRDLGELKLKIAYHRGQAAVLGTAAGGAMALAWSWFKDHLR